MITALRERRTGAGANDESTPRQTRWWFDLRLIAPIAAAAVYALAVVLRLPGLLPSFYWYSDFPEALRLGDAVFHGGWGQGLAVPSQSGLGPLWLVGLLHQVSGSDVAGMAAGAAMTVAAVAFMVAAAKRVLGSTGALAVGVLCIAAPPVVAWQLLTPVAHETTMLIAAAAAWQLVALSQPGRNHAIASSVGIGALAGVCIASDPLALPAAVLPWAICAVILVKRQGPRRIPLAVTAATATVSGVLVGVVATLNGIVARGSAELSPSLNGVTSGLRTTAATLGQMLTGAWYGDAIPDAIAVAAFILFAALLYIVSRDVSHREAQRAPGRDMYVWFWVLSSCGLIAALCVSGLGIQYDPVSYQGHYVDGLWFAIAALLPIGLLRPGFTRHAVGLVVVALVLSAAAGVARAPSFPFEDPDYIDGPQLTATLAQLGVTHGYGGYWESYAIGWHSDQRITALPLERCTDSSGARGLCRYEFAAPAWYAARSGPVFIVALRASCYNNDLCINVGNLAALPAPIATRTVGLLEVYVYDHDVLAHLPMATGP